MYVKLECRLLVKKLNLSSCKEEKINNITRCKLFFLNLVIRSGSVISSLNWMSFKVRLSSLALSWSASFRATSQLIEKNGKPSSHSILSKSENVILPGHSLLFFNCLSNLDFKSALSETDRIDFTISRWCCCFWFGFRSFGPGSCSLFHFLIFTEIKIGDKVTLKGTAVF